MLKKLLAISCFFMLIMAARAQAPLLTSSGDTLRIDTVISSSTSHIVQVITLRNNSATDTLQMNWRVTLNTFAHGTSWTICDPNLCYTPGQVTSVLRYSFLPQTTGIMKFDLTPMCSSSDATFRVHTWASNDSLNTQKDLVYIFKVNATCTGLKDIDPAQILLYPNPVRDEVHLSVPSSMDNAQIDIYNLIGSKVFSQAVSRERDLDVSALESGLYIARISDNGKVIATRKFTKAQ